VIFFILEKAKPPRGGDAKLWACPSGRQAAEWMSEIRALCSISSTINEDQDKGIAHVGPELEKGERVMRNWWETVFRFIEKEDGPTAVEYAVMLALIIVVCLTAITTLGQNANSTFSNVALNGTLKASAS
jgi:pilus assembly protein Flp/PilA